MLVNYINYFIMIFKRSNGSFFTSTIEQIVITMVICKILDMLYTYTCLCLMKNKNKNKTFAQPTSALRVSSGGASNNEPIDEVGPPPAQDQSEIPAQNQRQGPASVPTQLPPANEGVIVQPDQPDINEIFRIIFNKWYKDQGIYKLLQIMMDACVVYVKSNISISRPTVSTMFWIFRRIFIEICKFLFSQMPWTISSSIGAVCYFGFYRQVPLLRFLSWVFSTIFIATLGQYGAISLLNNFPELASSILNEIPDADRFYKILEVAANPIGHYQKDHKIVESVNFLDIFGKRQNKISMQINKPEFFTSLRNANPEIEFTTQIPMTSIDKSTNLDLSSLLETVVPESTDIENTIKQNSSIAEKIFNS